MLLNIKKIFFCIVLVGNISCGVSQNENSTILFDVQKLTSGECGSGFTVKKKLEPDPVYQKELEKYLYKSFIDNKECEEISSDLFERKSFKVMVLEVYLDSTFLSYSIYDYESRWRESYINLLNYCTNQKVFYSLCDSLLLNNIDDGLIAVWDKDPKKLHYLKRYEENNWEDYFQVAQLAAIYHNSGMNAEEGQAIKQLKKLNYNEASTLLNLLKESKYINYFDFMEIVYRGM